MRIASNMNRTTIDIDVQILIDYDYLGYCIRNWGDNNMQITCKVIQMVVLAQLDKRPEMIFVL